MIYINHFNHTCFYLYTVSSDRSDPGNGDRYLFVFPCFGARHKEYYFRIPGHLYHWLYHGDGGGSHTTGWVETGGAYNHKTSFTVCNVAQRAMKLGGGL